MLNIPEQYIKMCKQAKELQELWNPQDGDWFATNQNFMPNIFVISGYHTLVEELGGTMYFYDGHLCNRDGGCLANETACYCMNEKGIKPDGLQTFIVSSYKDMIWLPRQDQLQILLNEDAWEWFYFNYFTAESFRNPDKEFPFTAEEIGLKRYMADNYDKYWVDDKWVDIKN